MRAPARPWLFASDRRTSTLSSPSVEREDVEVTVAGRDRELEVDLVDDDDRLEPVGDRDDLGERHAVAGRDCSASRARRAGPRTPRAAARIRSAGCRVAGCARGTAMTLAPARAASTANIGNVGVGTTTASPGPTTAVVTRRISSSAPEPGMTRCGATPGMRTDRGPQAAVAEVPVFDDGRGVPAAATPRARAGSGPSPRVFMS